MIIPKNKEIKLYEAFAGIGSQFKALKNISKSKGWNIKHVGMAEWYIDAIIAFVAIHAEEINPKKEKFESNVTLSSDSKKPLGILSKGRLSNSLKSYYLNYSKNFFNNIFDIRSLNASNLPKEIDIFTYSFPCQDLSSQGLQKGIDKKLNTRSGLLWEIERILKDIKISLKTEEMPKYLLMENVKNLLASKNMKNYKKWINQLNKLGYNSKSYLLDASKFGIPQKRESISIIYKKGFSRKK